jgi:hypothetical protein
MNRLEARISFDPPAGLTHSIDEFRVVVCLDLLESKRSEDNRDDTNLHLYNMITASQK